MGREQRNTLDDLTSNVRAATLPFGYCVYWPEHKDNIVPLPTDSAVYLNYEMPFH